MRLLRRFAPRNDRKENTPSPFPYEGEGGILKEFKLPYLSCDLYSSISSAISFLTVVISLIR